MEKKLLYRWLVSAVLWAAIIIAVVGGIRASGDAHRVVAEISSRVLTPEQEAMETQARELARAFAVEWATWTGDAAEYRDRLAGFLADIPNDPVPHARQQVVSAAVLGGGARPQTEDGGDGAKNVPVLLHVRRQIPTAPDGGAADGGSVWAERLLAVEVPVLMEPGQPPAVAGLPALAPMPAPAGRDDGPRLRDTAPSELVSFLRQFLALYYEGGDLANFLAEGSGVKPLGGWKLATVGEILVDDAADPSQASVKVRVSGEGVDWLYQELDVGLTREKGKYLVSWVSAF